MTEIVHIEDDGEVILWDREEPTAWVESDVYVPHELHR